MYRHVKVTSQANMIDKIFEFLSDLFNKQPTTQPAGGSSNARVFKVLTKNNRQIIWFMTNTAVGDFSVWISDINEDRDVPWEKPSTMAYAARYKLDMSRREPDYGKAASEKAEMIAELNRCYAYRMQYAKTDLDVRLEQDMIRDRVAEVQKNHQVFKEDVEWYRMDGVNVFHVCSTLSYNNTIPTTKSFKWLDCLYTDGNFMFSVYTDDIPNSTKNLVIGDLDIYAEGQDFGRSFLFSNSFIIKSNEAVGSRHSGFFLEDEWGLGCEPRCQNMYSFIKENLEEKRKATDKAKQEKNNAENDVADKQKEVDDKIAEILAKKEELSKETDPAKRAIINQQIQALQQEEDDLEDELADLNDTLKDKEDDFEEAEKSWCIGTSGDSDYEKALEVAQDAAVRPEDYQHNYKNIQAEQYRKDEDSYFFTGLRIDVDYDKIGDAEYCIKHTWDTDEAWYYFRWHVNKPYLKIYNLYPPYSPSWPVIKNLLTPRHISWEYQLGHLTYENFEHEDAPNYYSQFDLEKKTYEIPDSIRNQFKKFEFWKRSWYGGNSVNHSNNVSQLMPIIWYVQRDIEDKDDWSAVGQSNVIKYINMYNIGTGRVMQPQFPEPHNRYACYNLWRRRPIWTKWIDECNDTKDEFKSIYGYGGYPGIGFKLLEKEDLTSLRGRVKDDL